jgi:hypothetical protein
MVRQDSLPSPLFRGRHSALRPRWAMDTGLVIDPKTSGQKKDLVQPLGFITAGVAVAFGIYFTWRGQRLTQRGQEENQRNTQEQLRLSYKGCCNFQKFLLLSNRLKSPDGL